MTKAQRTRQYILEKAFELIYRHGYQGTSIDKIIETTELTKGAFFYHFKNKEEMGLSMIREIILPQFHARLIDPIAGSPNAPQRIYETIRSHMINLSPDQLRHGCPVGNLIQEMSDIHAGFNEALLHILNIWKKEITRALAETARRGRIREQDFDQVADFLIAGYEGARATGKLYHAYDYYESYLGQLKKYLTTL